MSCFETKLFSKFSGTTVEGISVKTLKLVIYKFLIFYLSVRSFLHFRFHWIFGFLFLVVLDNYNVCYSEKFKGWKLRYVTYCYIYGPLQVPDTWRGHQICSGWQMTEILLYTRTISYFHLYVTFVFLPTSSCRTACGQKYSIKWRPIWKITADPKDCLRKNKQKEYELQIWRRFILVRWPFRPITLSNLLWRGFYRQWTYSSRIDSHMSMTACLFFFFFF